MTAPSCHVQLFASTPNAAIRWRLLSGNNREIGRGAESFADAETCRVAVKELQIVIAECEPVIGRADRNSWTWQLLLAQHVVAMSARGYDRQIRCQRGLAQFIDELRSAVLGTGVMISQSRRWGGSYA